MVILQEVARNGHLFAAAAICERTGLLIVSYPVLRELCSFDHCPSATHLYHHTRAREGSPTAKPIQSLLLY